MTWHLLTGLLYIVTPVSVMIQIMSQSISATSRDPDKSIIRLDTAFWDVHVYRNFDECYKT